VPVATFDWLVNCMALLYTESFIILQHRPDWDKSMSTAKRHIEVYLPHLGIIQPLYVYLDHFTFLLQMSGQLNANNEFMEQLRMQELYNRRREAGSDPNTYTDPEDGTVYDWDHEKKAWFPKV